MRAGKLMAALLLLLTLSACGAEPAGGQVDVSVGDTDAACRLPDAFSPQRWGEGYMTLADKKQTALISVTWRTDSACPDLYSYLSLEGLGTEGLVSVEKESALYDLRDRGEGLCWYLFRAPVAVKMSCVADKDSPWYDLEASLFFRTPSDAEPVSESTDAYLRACAETLGALGTPETPAALTAAVEAVYTDALRRSVAWMEGEGLLRYVSSDRTAGLYLARTDAGYDAGIYVGGYDGRDRSGPGALWLTIQADGSRLYIGKWAGDLPEGAFTAAAITAEEGSLLLFSGGCSRGVWDGEIAVSYTDGAGESLSGVFACDGGTAPVERRGEDAFWNEDVNQRFCYLCLTDGGDTRIPLYRSWSDRYFVMRMAYDMEALKDG